MRNPVELRRAGYQAFVVLFCVCGAQIELFNGELGSCNNPRCPEFKRLYSVDISVNDVHPSQIKATA